MKTRKEKKDIFLKEYDFSSGVRGKYSKQYRKGTNIVVLEPDVAKTFHDSKSVNKALRSLRDLIQEQSRDISL